jgi:hypothetical protein
MGEKTAVSVSFPAKSKEGKRICREEEALLWNGSWAAEAIGCASTTAWEPLAFRFAFILMFKTLPLFVVCLNLRIVKW